MANEVCHKTQLLSISMFNLQQNQVKNYSDFPICTPSKNLHY